MIKMTRTDKSVKELLDELLAQGFAWREISLLLNAGVASLRTWRKDNNAPQMDYEHLKQLIFFLTWLESELKFSAWLTNDKPIDDMVGWLMTPLVQDAPVTRLDLLIEERPDLVIASIKRNPEEILDEFSSEWHLKYRSRYEVFVAGDGQRSIRKKDEDG